MTSENEICRGHAGRRLPASGTRGGGLQVLVVEDHEEMADMLAEILTGYGHRVRVALDGPAALERAREGAPDVILLDIGLPGMDGYEVARHLPREPGGSRPFVIALSGCGTADGPPPDGTGIHLCLEKPVDLAYLRQTLDGLQGTLSPGNDAGRGQPRDAAASKKPDGQATRWPAW